MGLSEKAHTNIHRGLFVNRQNNGVLTMEMLVAALYEHVQYHTGKQNQKNDFNIAIMIFQLKS